MDREQHLTGDFEHFLRMASRAISNGILEEEDTPLELMTREYLENNWRQCRDGLLARTSKIRVTPVFSPPSVLRFEIDCPFKSKRDPEAPPLLLPGPVRGELIYRRDMLVNSDGPWLVVLIDRDLGYFHPNYDRSRGFLCIGDLHDLPPGSVPLDQLLENHLFPIITYQNRRPAHPADLDAARYFALEPTAMEGLEPVEPLY